MAVDHVFVRQLIRQCQLFCPADMADASCSHDVPSPNEQHKEGVCVYPHVTTVIVMHHRWLTRCGHGVGYTRRQKQKEEEVGRCGLVVHASVLGIYPIICLPQLQHQTTSTAAYNWPPWPFPWVEYSVRTEFPT